MSDGLSFEEFVAVDDGVVIGPGARGLEIDDILNILHPASVNNIGVGNGPAGPSGRPAQKLRGRYVGPGMSRVGPGMCRVEPGKPFGPPGPCRVAGWVRRLWLITMLISKMTTMNIPQYPCSVIRHCCIMP